MVTTTALGRLGNQCFQLATGLSYAFQNNLEFSAPLNSHPHFVNLINPNLNPNLERVYIPETSFNYEPLEFKEEWRDKNIIIQGYRQSAKYFDMYREEILKLFDFPYEFKNDFVSVHIRRGDYLNLENFHPTVTLDYIYKSIYHFTELGYKKFLFFSDDISWCRQNIRPNIGLYFKFSEGKTDVEDLALASSCEHNIGSNSAFSFFIHWLNRNENKIGVFPKKSAWFGSELPHNVDDLYMKEWCLV